MIKVMTFNIQHGIDHPHRIKTKEMVVDLDKVINLIKKYSPDIVGLNEVYDAPHPFLEKQAEYIASKLGYYYEFGKAINIKNGYYGNALISKYPIDKVQIIKIPDPIEKNENVFYESRSIIKSIIKVNGESYNVLVSHFGLAESERKNATNTLLNCIENLDNVIFMGDLNMERENLNIQKIENKLKNCLISENYTYPSDNPKIKIDYIFVSKDMEIKDSQIINEVVSDHLPHITTILKKIQKMWKPFYKRPWKCIKKMI